MSYIVENITTKEVNTKFGPKPVYSVYANGERFGYGWKKPAFTAGDEIDFQYTEGKYGKDIDLNSVKMLKKGDGMTPALPAAPSAPARPAFAQKVFPIPLLHGDRAIVRQNSVTNATKLVIETNGTEKSAEELAEQIINIARMFEAYSCGDLEALAAEEMSKEGTDA